MTWKRLRVGRTDHQPDAGEQAELRRDGRLPADRERREVPGDREPARRCYVSGTGYNKGLGQRRSSCRSLPTSTLSRTCNGQVRSRRRSAAPPGACCSRRFRTEPSADRRRAQEPEPARGRRQHRRGQDRRARRLLPVVGDHASSAAPAGRSTTAARPACRTCTASWCARTSPRSTPRSSSPSSRPSIDAGDWIDTDPVRATQMMEKWTGVEKEVLYLYFSPRRPPDARPDHQAAVGRHAEVRPHGAGEGEGWSRRSTSTRWITDSYIRQAYAELGLGTTTGRKVRLVDPGGRARMRACRARLARPRRDPDLPDVKELPEGGRRVQATGGDAERHLRLRPRRPGSSCSASRPSTCRARTATLPPSCAGTRRRATRPARAARW